MQIAPSKMRKERTTSNVKSACPGVSIKLMSCDGTDDSTAFGFETDNSCFGKGGQLKDMAADWMVTPLARSAGRKSVTVEPSSTSVE